MTLKGNGNVEMGTTFIGGSGDVGIGTPFPVTKLDVRGDIALGPSGSLFAPGGEEVLRIVRGVVEINGSVFAGTGFAASKLSTGDYMVTYSTAFSSMPSVAITPVFNVTSPDPLQCNVQPYITLNSDNAGSFELFTGDSKDLSCDTRFSFIAMGPR